MEAIDMLLEQWQKSGLSQLAVAEKFSGCDLYVTCEPCIMCASALSILGLLINPISLSTKENIGVDLPIGIATSWVW